MKWKTMFRTDLANFIKPRQNCGKSRREKRQANLLLSKTSHDQLENFF
jgi:hypothetical protein